MGRTRRRYIWARKPFPEAVDSANIRDIPRSVVTCSVYKETLKFLFTMYLISTTCPRERGPSLVSGSAGRELEEAHRGQACVFCFDLSPCGPVCYCYVFAFGVGIGGFVFAF